MVCSLPSTRRGLMIDRRGIRREWSQGTISRKRCLFRSSAGVHFEPDREGMRRDR